MDHITIPIPDGISPEQKRDMTGYLTDRVKEMTGGVSAIDDDPKVQAEIVCRIKQGIADAEAGRFVDSHEARQRMADYLESTRPE